MTNFVVTACGTDIGKTHVTCALLAHFCLHGRAVQAFKPVISGMQGVPLAATDSGRLLQAMGREVTQETVRAISPWQLAAPLTPSMAARAEGVTLSMPEVAQWCRAQLEAQPESLCFIEGAGGVMAPLTDTHTMRDWFVEMNMPVVLVVGCYLGSISHALTALAALAPLQVACVIISDKGDASVGLTATQAELRRFIPSDIAIFSLPNAASAMAESVEIIAHHLESLC